MVARTPHRAAQEFFEPLQQALGCIVAGKIVTSPGGKSQPDKTHSWIINDGGMAAVGRDLFLVARMLYRIIRSDDGWRVTTEAYQYAYKGKNSEIVSWHWHPSGNSHYRLPHLHVGVAVPVKTGVLTPRSHLRTARTPFEEIVGIGISELGVEPRTQDWRERLDACLNLFEMNRTWQDTPDKRVARPWA